MWVARESSCVLRTGDAQAAHSRKTGDETWRAIRLPGHEALKWNPCCPCAVTGSTTRLGGPCSNTDDVQKVQSCKPEEKSKMAPGGHNSFLAGLLPSVFIGNRESWTWISCQNSFQVSFLLLLPSTATEESLSHCCSNTPTMVLGAAATPKSPLVYLLEKSTQPPKAISSQHLSSLSACALWRHCWDNFLSWVTACSRLLHRKSEECTTSSTVPNLPIPVPFLLPHIWGSCLKQGQKQVWKLAHGPPIWVCQFKKMWGWAAEVIYKFSPNLSGFQILF